MIKQYIPSLITVFRIVGSIILFFMIPFQFPFYVLYTLCGISDVLDGVLARAWKVQTDRGAILDSIADLVFYIVFMIRLLPVLQVELPGWGWGYFFAVLFLRLLSYLTVALKFHRFAAVHTYGNKMTGVALFCVPYMRFGLNMPEIALIVCTIALVATVEEWMIHLHSDTYNPDIKTYVTLMKMKSHKNSPNSV